MADGDRNDDEPTPSPEPVIPELDRVEEIARRRVPLPSPREKGNT